MASIAIDGLGRIGRAALKILEQDNDALVVGGWKNPVLAGRDPAGAGKVILEAFTALGLPAPDLSQIRP